MKSVSQNLYTCNKFLGLSVAERRELVKQKSLCWLCLKPQHTVNECKFKKMCPHCEKKHNGLLHIGDQTKKQTKNVEQSKKSFVVTTQDENIVCASCSTENDNRSHGTLLTTAVIKVKSPNGIGCIVRVLIDQGSMASFVSERVVSFLGLEQIKHNINICGIAGSVEPAKGTARMQITARYPTSFKVDITAIVLNKNNCVATQ